MALGAALKEARMRKKLTASEVAGGTRMKTQTVTALEEEDFDKIAAPIYAKGFIKLYAEFVGLDPQALVAEYVERFLEAKPNPEPAATPEPISVPATEPDLSRRSEAKAPPRPEPVVEEVRPEPAAPEPVAEEVPLDLAPPEPVADVSRQSETKPDLSLRSEAKPEGELDLFSEVDPGSNERRGILMDEGYREEAPSLQNRMGHAVAGAVDAIQHCGDSVGASCRRACGGCSSFAVNTWKRLVDTVAARRKELSQIDFKNLSARHMMALLGVLVLVLLVISSLSRCVRGKGEVEVPENTSHLPVAAEPDDVYLD